MGVSGDAVLYCWCPVYLAFPGGDAQLLNRTRIRVSVSDEPAIDSYSWPLTVPPQAKEAL